MKTRAWILSIILAVVILQPPFTHLDMNEEGSSCSKPEKSRSICSMSNCEDSEPTDENDECENKRCNPLLGCPSGNFYIHNFTSLLFALPIIKKEKPILVNDNRLFMQLSECWQPPEIN